MKKLNNLSEKLRALADGEKIRDSNWDKKRFIQIKGGIIIDECGTRIFDVDTILSCDEIYEAPKDDNLYEWIIQCANSNGPWENVIYLRTKEEAKKYFSNAYNYAIKSGPYNPKDFKKE